MSRKRLIIAETAMFVGLAIAIIGGLATVIFSPRGSVDGLVFWGVGSAFLIFSAARVVIGILKQEIRQSLGRPND